MCTEKKYFSYFLAKTYAVGTQKEPSQRDGSSEHPKHLLKLMGKKIFTLRHFIYLNLCYIMQSIRHFIVCKIGMGMSSAILLINIFN